MHFQMCTLALTLETVGIIPSLKYLIVAVAAMFGGFDEASEATNLLRTIEVAFQLSTFFNFDLSHFFCAGLFDCRQELARLPLVNKY